MGKGKGKGRRRRRRQRQHRLGQRHRIRLLLKFSNMSRTAPNLEAPTRMCTADGMLWPHDSFFFFPFPLLFSFRRRSLWHQRPYMNPATEKKEIKHYHTSSLEIWSLYISRDNEEKRETERKNDEKYINWSLLRQRLLIRISTNTGGDTKDTWRHHSGCQVSSTVSESSRYYCLSR